MLCAKKVLKSRGYVVIDPEEYGLGDASWRTVVRRNNRDIAGADAVVAICTQPSFGVGGELVVAKTLGVQVFSLVPKESKIPAWVAAHSTAFHDWAALESWLTIACPP